MNAGEARKLARVASKNEPCIGSYVMELNAAIGAAARRGMIQIQVPGALAKLPPMTDREQNAIQLHFVSLGFVWVPHPVYPHLTWAEPPPTTG